MLAESAVRGRPGVGAVTAVAEVGAGTAAGVMTGALSTALSALSALSAAASSTTVGVADIYQGSELTRTSLVDPDNRRPVRYDGEGGLREMLSQVSAGGSPRTLDQDKLRLTHRLARLRAERPDTFVGPRSGYRTVPVTTSHAFAYARLLDEAPDVVVIVRRLGRRLRRLGGWREESVVLPDGPWTEVLTDRPVDGGAQRLADVVGDLPVVVLARDREVGQEGDGDREDTGGTA